MAIAVVASQSPAVFEFGLGSPAPAPAPPASAPPSIHLPQPPPYPRPAFSAIELPSLFGIVGTFIPDSTIATITCDDPAPLIHLSESVPGLTFSIVGKVLHVEGTPALPTDVHRVLVTYMASDGSYASIGSTSCLITIVSASEVLTIGDMGAAGGKVGYPFSANLVALSTNYPVVVTATSDLQIQGLTIALPWTKGPTSGSGTVQIFGLPASGTNGTYTINLTYRARGVVLGVSTHTIIVAAPYEAAPVIPSPVAAPPPPAYPPPPDVDVKPTKYYGPDEFLPQTIAVLHFDTATGFARDTVGLRDFGNNGVAAVPGFVGQSARFTSAATFLDAAVPELAIVTPTDENLTVDAIVKVTDGSGLWALPADSRIRFMPVVSAYNLNDQLLWSLGFKVFTEFNQFSGSVESKVVPVFLCASESPWTIAVPGPQKRLRATMVEAQANVLPTSPDRFIHIRGQFLAGAPRIACWFDGVGPHRTGGFAGMSMQRPNLAVSRVRIGGTCMLPGVTAATGQNFVAYSYQGPPRPLVSAYEISEDISDLQRFQRYDEVLPCIADVDEVRITKAARAQAFITEIDGLQLNLPAYAVNPPWTDY